MMRLDKFLSNIGLGSRKDVKKILSAKRVQVNGNIIKEASFKVNENTDCVRIDQKILTYQKYYYLLLNKPKGYISATEDLKHKTVLDLLEPIHFQANVFPVGRLDRDTTGLLLLTNNGELAHQLLSPNKKVSKCYRAKIQGIVTAQDSLLFAKGLDLGDFHSQPARLSILEINEQTKQTLIEVEIHEGKFHQVKRMFHKVGKEVLELERISMGPLKLPIDLQRGTYRELNEEEKIVLVNYGLE